MDMGSRKIKRAILLTACACLLASSVGGSDAALIKVGNLVLKADGGFVPSALPRGHDEPLDFDKDLRIESRGLPVCSAAKIAHATVGQARRRCAKSIVGTGHVGAFFDLFGAPVEARVKATLFNGPRQNGKPTVIGHTFTTLPTTKTYMVVIPLEPMKGQYSYQATVDVPTLAAGGVLTHIDGRIGRRYDYRGRQRSYVNARCTSGVIRVHGRFDFAEGMIMDGTLEKPCTPVPLVPGG